MEDSGTKARSKASRNRERSSRTRRRRRSKDDDATKRRKDDCPKRRKDEESQKRNSDEPPKRESTAQSRRKPRREKASSRESRSPIRTRRSCASSSQSTPKLGKGQDVKGRTTPSKGPSSTATRPGEKLPVAFQIILISLTHNAFSYFSKGFLSKLPIFTILLKLRGLTRGRLKEKAHIVVSVAVFLKAKGLPCYFCCSGLSDFFLLSHFQSYSLQITSSYHLPIEVGPMFFGL